MDKFSTDNRFFELVKDMDLTEIGVRSLESLKAAREEILMQHTSYLADFDDLNVDDPAEVVATMDALTLSINRYFSHMKGAEFGDEVIASGESLIMIVDEESNTRAFPLSHTIKIRGNIGALAVIDSPDISVMEMVRANEIDPERQQIPMNHFSVAILLENAAFIYDNGHVQPAEDNHEIYIPLEYSQLILKRVV